MLPIIIALAPVSQTVLQEISYDYTSKGVAQDILACAEQGASMVHLHVRDNNGVQTTDLSIFDETLRIVREYSNIVLQGSTGGPTSLALEKRAVSLRHPLVQIASLNLGSINLGDDVYINTIPNIRYYAEQMNKASIRAELEVFDLSMIYTAQRLVNEGVLNDNLIFNIALGFESALPANERTLAAMVFEINQIPHAKWGLIHHNMQDLSLLAAAIGMGANMIRVGYEDSIYIKSGCIAQKNADLVKHVADMMKMMGKDVASPAQTKEILEIQK